MSRNFTFLGVFLRPFLRPCSRPSRLTRPLISVKANPPCSSPRQDAWRGASECPIAPDAAKLRKAGTGELMKGGAVGRGEARRGGPGLGGTGL
ncbi:hypothetical protein E2C01_082776 [Portunus trituberculatus]|uniref:Uncharacterized protein n=1 Tax=Portunus trituberculatus TaxID=210409 RepID=A0A5B7J1Q4_PORTR|nr:hypothetical protein [Portunus trituberculatus]